MTNKTTPAELERLIKRVHADLAACDAEIGPFPSGLDGIDDWRARRRKAETALRARLAAEERAAFTENPPHDHAVRLAGIRSSSTSGWTGALRNWIRAAGNRLEGEKGQ